MGRLAPARKTAPVSVALVAEPAGWASPCRALTRLHLPADVRLTELLRASADGLHILADDPAPAE